MENKKQKPDELLGKKITIPELNVKKFDEPPQGYLVIKHTRKGDVIDLSKQAKREIEKRLEEEF